MALLYDDVVKMWKGAKHQFHLGKLYTWVSKHMDLVSVDAEDFNLVNSLIALGIYISEYCIQRKTDLKDLSFQMSDKKIGKLATPKKQIMSAIDFYSQNFGLDQDTLNTFVSIGYLVRSKRYIQLQRALYEQDVIIDER